MVVLCSSADRSRSRHSRAVHPLLRVCRAVQSLDVLVLLQFLFERVNRRAGLTPQVRHLEIERTSRFLERPAVFASIFYE